MGKSPDIAIFRRFNEFNMLNLLRLQAEIAALRTDFWTRCEADDLSGPPFDKLSESFFHHHDENKLDDTTQYGVLRQISEKMKEYSEYLYICTWIGPLRHARR